MGVTKFFKIVIPDKNQTFGSLGDEITLKSLGKFTLAIDASYVIYNSATATSSMSYEGKTTAHIAIILKKVLMFAKMGIEQIWVFDNPTRNPLKQERPVSDDRFRMTSEHVYEVQKLLHLLGQLYIIAPPGIEAEHLAAALTRHGLCEYVLSGDSDVLMFGGNLLMQDRNKPGKYKTYNYDRLLLASQLSREDLLKCGVIMGCDFCDGTPRVAERTVIKKYKTVVLTDQQLRAMDEYDKPAQIDVAEHVQGTLNLEGVDAFLKARNFKVYNLDVLK